MFAHADPHPSDDTVTGDPRSTHAVSQPSYAATVLTDAQDDGASLDLRARALELVSSERYLVLSTISAEGEPWACPVWFAHDGLERFFWLSRPHRTHSVNIEKQPRIGLVVFNSQQPVGIGLGFYAAADARVVPDDELDAALAILSPRSVAHGGSSWDRERITPLPVRLYEARAVELWLNPGQGSDVRQRVPKA